MAFNLCYTLAIDERDGEMESKIIKSVFIVCENDNYGEALYKGIFNTKEEARSIVGRDDDMYIIEHELYEDE